MRAAMCRRWWHLQEHEEHGDGELGALAINCVAETDNLKPGTAYVLIFLMSWIYADPVLAFTELLVIHRVGFRYAAKQSTLGESVD